MNESVKEDELTIKEVVVKIKDIWSEIVSKWYFVLIIILLLTGYFLYTAFNTKAKYVGETKFYIEGSSGSSLGGLLGTFGLGGATTGKNNPFQILEVAQSKLLLADILFTKTDSESFLANQIISDYKLDKKWSENNKNYIDFRFTHANVDSFSRLEDVVLIQLQNLVISGDKDNAPLRDITFDKKNSFFKIASSSLSSEVTLALCDQTLSELNKHYKDKAIAGYIKTKDILKLKVDSLQNLLTNKMYSLNRFGDQSQQLLSLEIGTKRDILKRDISGLSIAYGEALKSYELAQFNIENLKTNFVLIDRPFTPLFPISPSLIMEGIKGLFIGTFLSFFFIGGVKILRDILNDD